MARILALTMAAGVATASPVSSVWQLTKPHGWSKPSVYTPPQPTPTDYYPSMYPLTSAYANATATTSMAYPTASMGACASVSMLAAADPAPTPLVPAKIAHDCITSIPFNSSAAVELLDSIRPYLDWQTTIDYIRDPPSEYAEKIQEPYDFYAEFERIYGTAKSGGYDSEFAFGFDLYEAFQRSHDGHFVYYPDSVTGIFSWGRTTPLVSVSRDGEEVPQVYAYADILAASFGNTTFTPSPLTEIDGQNATEFLLHWAQYGSLQDRDALWNNVFYSLAQVSLGSSGSGTGTFSGGGRGARIYPGETTTLTFANGTTVTNENFARVLVPFDNITTGEDIYRQYFALPPDEPQYADEIATSTSSSATSSATSSSTSTSTQSIPAPGYPTPVIRGAGNANSGYFLDGDYDDVAVLAVASFVGGSGSQENFQAVNTYLIDQAVAQGKTKLIIDVSANGGGTILQGYDLFTQLFPQILPYGANRFRAHEAFDLVGQEVSEYSGQFDRSSPSLNESVRETLSSTFNYRTDATVDYEPFTSWEEKFGPHAYGPGPDNYTSLIRWNLSDPLITENSGGIYVSGYQNRSNITAQPFAAENIVIVYDGYCASTCTIFSEFMRQQAGVRTIALGGRPNTDIIQAVGGVKGTNSFPWTYILENIELPFQFQQLHSAEYYANETALGSYSDLPLLRATNYVVNARDGIRQGDATETPLHFVYEPADCRIFYTPEMVVDQEAVWKTVADAAFNGAGGEFCVAGGLTASGNSTSRYRRVIGSSGQKKHAVRKDCDRSALAAAIGSVFTGEITNGGDGFMYP